ncbi:hypothetical protein GLOIN_2v1885507 [Rhizophagus irregularis DAOM 181602=DAOM 197198]|nr:hypothetical protein GLOIN_2v1885507 [Rhizophagus irregularis DAOM 181602=DAOM 197198]
MFDQTEETLLIIKFECTLQSQEQYIKYLYGVVSGYESEIEELRQKNAELRIKLKNALEAVSLKEEGLQALERQLIEVDTLNIQLKARIKELARRQQKNMPQSPQSHNSIREILNHRDLDAIIRYADELRNIIEDKNNNEVRLEDLLDDAFNREEYLRQELNNTRASVLNTRCTFKDAYIQELHHRQHWKGLAQNTQTQLANSQIQLANTQTQFESRRNAHRLLQRYNRETEWNRRICFQNLNQQFLIIQSAMAGYAPKKFRGVSGEDPELWLQEFRQLCESAGLDPAANARTCVRIHGIFESLLEDDARDWFEMHIKGKNWKCANIRNNLAVANLAAANGMNNGAIHVENQMETRRIGLENSVAFILNKLEEIERYKTDTAPASISTHTPIVTYQGPTLADIENLINSKIPVIAPSAVPPLAAVLSSSPFSSFQKDVSFQRLVALGYKLGLLRDIDISKISIEDLEAFIDTELNKNLPPNHAYHGNQVFDSDSYSASRHTCYGLKKRVQKEGVWIRKKEALVQSFINAVPKEIIISVYNALNAEFINYKEPILNQLKGSPSIKT